MSPFAKLTKLTPLERAAFAEALVMLPLASAAVSLLPFRAIAKFASRPPSRTDPSQSRDELLSAVRRAVIACARRVPCRAKCFEQGLTALWMLRRRGMSATLHFGSAKEEEGLIAHVWVTTEGKPVVGCDNIERFSELARFPPMSISADP